MFCENCGKEHNGLYGSGRFCSCKCSRGFSTKAKRKDINKKVKDKLTGTGHDDVELTCKCCGKTFSANWKYRDQLFCSRKCSYDNLVHDTTIMNDRKKTMEIYFSDIKNRERMRNIGRMGGFGKKGYTKNGTRFESTLEEKSFSYLEDNNIRFEAHKHIPNSSKISDIYLTELDLWIELDGINREKRKEWLGKDYEYWKEKLRLYEESGFNYKVFLSFDDFKNFIIGGVAQSV